MVYSEHFQFERLKIIKKKITQRRIQSPPFFVYNQTVFKNPLTQKICDFLTEIGLQVESAEIADQTFLPGILIKNGTILVDETNLKYVGDLLHEAGHLAVAPAHLRSRLSDEVELPEFNMATIESAAMPWSYAAALHLEIDPRIVFHSEGYKGNAEGILFTFNQGVFFGANILTDAEMTAIGEKALKLNVPPFPFMLKWTRD